MLSLSVQRDLSCLLDWQLWYWGQDIDRDEGNALLHYGFRRVRGPADGTQRSSAYELLPEPATNTSPHRLERLIAWGFGISASLSGLAEKHGTLLLVRHERSPGLCMTPIDARAGTRSLLPPRNVPRSLDEWICLRATVSAVARCCATYEEWGRQQLGVAHRVDAHQRRPRAIRRRHDQSLFLDDAWRRLAHRVDESLASQRAPEDVLS